VGVVVVTDIGKVMTVSAIIAIIMGVSLVFGSRKLEGKAGTKVEYRFYGDKTRPSAWLRKYTVPESYHVWDCDLGRYVEVSKDRYDQEPAEGVK